jgi:phage tail sheath protein FI
MPELLHPGVYVQELPSAVKPIEGVSTSTAAFVGVADKGPIPGRTLPNGRPAQPVLITSFTDYTRQFGGFRQDSFLTYAVRAFYDNGGRRLYVVRVAPGDVALATSPPVLSPPASPLGGWLPVSASSEGAWGNDVWISVQDSSDLQPGNFKLVIMVGTSLSLAQANIVETFDNVTFRSASAAVPLPPNYVRTLVNARSSYIAITADIFAAPAKGGPIQLSGGADGTAAVDPIGAPAASSTVTGTGLHALDKVTDVNLIAIPGNGKADTVNKGMAYCKNRPLQDCFFIGDSGSIADVRSARAQGAQPDDVITISDARAFASPAGLGGPPLDKSSGDYGAIYYPWIRTDDPIGAGPNPQILLPPSPYLAGIYARIDNSRGVFKAPAGTEAGVVGALAPATVISDTDQDGLNPLQVNAIRTVPAGGIVVWGTRTIGSDASWRYIPVRRIAIFLRVSIYYGIQWAVFEPNDEPLWAALRLNIRSFMLTQFRAGAFQGSKPDDAFFVKCDATTTTQQDIDNGVVNILVGFAPLKPAEFVVLKLSQKINQPAA